MKKFSLTTLLIIITLGFSSCTQDDNTLLEEPTAEDLLKSYKIQRDASGAYSIDYDLSDGAGVDIVSNEKTNTKDLYLYPSENQSRRSLNEEVSLKGFDNFNLGLNNTEKNIKSTITVYDNDIIYDRSTENEDHLESYDFGGGDDENTFDLNFTVKDNIVVDFIYNEETETYEIHLAEGTSSQKEFLRTFNKDQGEELKITFVNYFNRSMNRSVSSTSRPRVVVQ